MEEVYGSVGNVNSSAAKSMGTTSRDSYARLTTGRNRYNTRNNFFAELSADREQREERNERR
jgi:hypothetical protein